jgi:hypothetical protein
MIKVSNIQESIKSKGLKKAWIIEQLGVSKKTFYSRLKDKEFKHEEVKILKRLGLIN